MNTHELNQPDALPDSRPFLPLLLLLFVGSGCSALIYEIVWFQLLQFVIGSSTVSLAVLLGTFMGGMCLGSLALPRLVSAGRHPLRVYALLELGIGACGILVFFGMPHLNDFYAAASGTGYLGLLMRGAVCAVCLLPPTLMMGATLPAVSRGVEATPAGVSWLGFFYGGNIAGAVFGCLLAGFYLLRVHDALTATCVAAAVNGGVALAGFALAFLMPHSSAEPGTRNEERHVTDATHPDFPARNSVPVYLAIALSGLAALGAEVVWTRILSLMLGATVYTFSIILAVFLIGLGVGSSVGSLMARSAVSPRLLLGLCQMLLAAAIAWSAYIMTQSLPYWPIDHSISRSPWYDFQLDLLRCLWAVFPATLLWGASFPLALAAVASRGTDSGRTVGAVYAANTAGAIVGALVTSLCLIPWAGSQATQRVLIGVSAAAALLMIVQLLWGANWLLIVAAVTSSAGVAWLAGVLTWTVPEVPAHLIAYGRRLPLVFVKPEIIYVGEGMNSWVAVSETKDDYHYRCFHVSGKVEASTYPGDMRLQRMLGHLSALVHSEPRDVLVVGCGAGVTAGSFTLHPSVKHVTICDIEPLVPGRVADYFANENYNVVHDERVEVVIDDARHYVLTTKKRFDVITSDPIHPWVKGAAALYTKEYFELVKSRLKPGGVVTQWVPLYECDEATVMSEIATFMEVFPDGTVWVSKHPGQDYYDVVLLGQAGATQIDLEEFSRRMTENERVAKSLREVEINDADDLLASYAGRGADLQKWLKDSHAEINRDRNLRLQYLAGMGVNEQMGSYLSETIVSYRRFPEDLFVGPELRKLALRERLKNGKSFGVDP
jgi:spermidine synthase